MRKLIDSAHRPVLYHALRLFRVRDGAERAGRGFAIGMIVNFFPTFGFGFVISGFLARLCGGNFIAGLAGGALFTPFWIPLFYLNMVVGGWLMDRMPAFTLDQVNETILEKFAWGPQFLLGAAINSTVFGLLAYGLVTGLMQEHRLALLKKIKLWRPRRKKRNHAS